MASRSPIPEDARAAATTAPWSSADVPGFERAELVAYELQDGVGARRVLDHARQRERADHGADRHNGAVFVSAERLGDSCDEALHVAGHDRSGAVVRPGDIRRERGHRAAA